jgi:hypothetical protein
MACKAETAGVVFNTICAQENCTPSALGDCLLHSLITEAEFAHFFASLLLLGLQMALQALATGEILYAVFAEESFAL